MTNQRIWLLSNFHSEKGGYHNNLSHAIGEDFINAAYKFSI